MTAAKSPASDVLPEPPVITDSGTIAAWFCALNTGAWTWTRNSRCKYVTLKIDTRRGCYRIEDRDGNQISFDDLNYQLLTERTTHDARR